MAFDDVDNYVRCFYGHITGTRQVELATENGGSWNSSNTPVDLGDSPFYLRLEKIGNRYTQTYSVDGVAYSQPLGSVTYGDGSPAQLGIWAGAAPSESSQVMVDSILVESIDKPGPTVLHYRFEEGPAESAVQSIVDSGPNELHGTAHGTLTYAEAGPDGADVGSFAMDGSGDLNYGSIPHDKAMEVQEFTLEAWVRPSAPYTTSGARPHNIVSKIITTTGNWITSYYLEYNPDTGVFAGVITTVLGGAGEVVISPGSYALGEWHHVALRLSRDINGDDDELALIINGEVVASRVKPMGGIHYDVNETDPLLIGSGNYGGVTSQHRRNFDGLIDEVRLSCVALPLDQLLSDRTAVAKNDPTVLHYRFEEGPGESAVQSLTDSGPNQLHGTVHGALTYAAAGPTGADVGSFAMDARGDLNYGSIPHDPVLEVQEFTLEAWVQPNASYATSGSRPHHIASKIIHTSGFWVTSYSIEYDPDDGVFSGHISTVAGSAGESLVSPGSYALGEWHHIALRLTRDIEGDDDELALLVNGEVVASRVKPMGSVHYDFNETDPFLIGSGNYGGAASEFRRNFDGLIDEVRLSCVPLPADQLLSAKLRVQFQSMSGGMISLNLRNLKPATQYRVERASSLKLRDWMQVDSFTADANQRDWSQSVSVKPGSFFYRVRTSPPSQ